MRRATAARQEWSALYDDASRPVRFQLDEDVLVGFEGAIDDGWGELRLVGIHLGILADTVDEHRRRRWGATSILAMASSKDARRAARYAVKNARRQRYNRAPPSIR